MMSVVLAPILGKDAPSFLDDIIGMSEDEKGHLLVLKKIFELLRKARLKLKPSKCFFFQEEVKFLGHQVDKDGIHPDPEKIEKVKYFQHQDTKKKSNPS